MSLPPTEPTKSTEPPKGEDEFQQQVRDYSRAARRWMWSSLNRESLVAGIKTLMWLMPLTLLIWVYAEREQVETTQLPEAIPIHVRIDDPKKLAYLAMNDRSVYAHLNGPKGRIEQVRAEISQQDVENAVALTVDPNLKPGTYDLSTERLLSSNPILVKYGVTAVNCKPETIPVIVDIYEEREAEVQAPDTVKNLLDPPIFTPATVTIRAPHRLMPTDSKLIVYADFAGDSTLDKPGAHEATKKISLPQVNSEYVSYSPAVVKASYLVRQSDAEYTLPSVPVNILAPQGLQSQNHVETETVITGVKVIGPQEKIDMLKNGTASVVAMLTVKREDADNATHTGMIRWVFSDGMEGVVVKDPARRPIDYKIVSNRQEQ